MVINLVDQLNDEWAELTARALDYVVEWSRRCADLDDCQSLPDVLVAIRQRPDETLTFLISRYQTGDALAGRTVLQAMLGKLVRMSYTGVAAHQMMALDDLVTQLWCRIGDYRLDRRPRRIAANLVLDTLKTVQREWEGGGEIPISPAAVIARIEDQQEAEPEEEPEWSAEVLIHAAFHLDLISATTRDILSAVYGAEELSGAEAALRWECSPAAIRTRCSTAVREQLTPLARQLVHELAA